MATRVRIIDFFQFFNKIQAYSRYNWFYKNTVQCVQFTIVKCRLKLQISILNECEENSFKCLGRD